MWLQIRCVYALWPFGFGFADLVFNNNDDKNPQVEPRVVSGVANVNKMHMQHVGTRVSIYEPPRQPKSPWDGGRLEAVGAVLGGVWGPSPTYRFAHPMEPPFERGPWGLILVGTLQNG